VTALAPTLEAFFTSRLTRQRRASGHTIAAYRDTWRLLLGWAAQRAGKPPSRLDLADLDAATVATFLDHLEHDRGNSIRTRNARLAAIHSMFSYAALRHPEHAALIARVLAIPAKRADKALVTWLTDDEADALLAAPDRATRTGRRDHAMLHLAVITGLRVSELTALTTADIYLGTGPHVTCHGKGRKQRITPLTAPAVTVLREWLKELRAEPAQILFPGRAGSRLSRDAVERRLTLHAATAAARCPSLAGKTITPHVLRHTAAMRLLHAGVEASVIALWLGHEQTETAQIYLHADITLKEKALARTTPPGCSPGRYRPPDPLLAFLESL
jgi:site-specific recombinase XerD